MVMIVKYLNSSRQERHRGFSGVAHVSLPSIYTRLRGSASHGKCLYTYGRLRGSHIVSIYLFLCH